MPRLTPIHFRTFCQILEKTGCVYQRQEGDHLIYHKKGASRAIVIPCYKELPIFVIQNNLKVAGISRKDYFRLLSKKK